MTTIPNIPHASVIEARIVGRLVADILAAGYSVDVWTGGDEPDLADCKDAATIFAALSSSDQDELTLNGPNGYAGMILLVWGNDCSVISNYSAKLTALVEPASALANEIECSEVMFEMNVAAMAKRWPRTTARFWVYTDKGLARVKLLKGQSLTHHEGGPTDEGFSYTATTWSFDDDRIVMERATSARDCDGPVSYGHAMYAIVGELAVVSAEDCKHAFPHWRNCEGTFYQRDAFAEQAGY